MITDLSIIIVSYNTRDELGACLESLGAAPPACSHEIVVVDNGSRDDSVALVRSDFPDVRLIEVGTNIGFGPANNRGVRATDSELILFLNSDTLVPRGAIDALIERLRTDAGVAIVGPRLVDAAGNVELSFGPMIGPWNEVTQKLKGFALAHRLAGVSRFIERSLSAVQYPDWVSGACLLVRRADAEAAGLFDERFFLYTEDVDFCAAVRALGRRVLFLPDVEMVHHRGRSGLGDRSAATTFYRRSQLAFYEKHHPHWAPVLRLYLRLKGVRPSDALLL